MTNLLIILSVLFASLFLVVKLTEKHGKPLTDEQSHKYSRIAMILMAVLLIAQLLYLMF